MQIALPSIYRKLVAEMVIRYLKFWLSILTLAKSLTSFACSSCGNGSSNPLYLYPSEQTKAYLGLTNESGFSDITYDGEAVPSYSLEQRISYTGAAGLRFNQRSFAVISLSAFKQVGRSGRSLTVIGEPNLSYRYAIVQPIFTRPLVPQVEFIGAFKAGSARNSSSSRDPEMLDVGGSGFDELTTGVDVWFGMTPIQFGGSFIHKLASPERTRLGLEHPGDTQTLSLSIGKSWTFLKVSLGPVVSRRFRKTRESSLVSDSDSYRQNFFLTLDGKIANQKFIRGTIVQNASFGFNRSTSRSLAFTVAMMWSS